MSFAHSDSQPPSYNASAQSSSVSSAEANLDTANPPPAYTEETAKKWWDKLSDNEKLEFQRNKNIAQMRQQFQNDPASQQQFPQYYVHINPVNFQEEPAPDYRDYFVYSILTTPSYRHYYPFLDLWRVGWDLAILSSISRSGYSSRSSGGCGGGNGGSEAAVGAIILIILALGSAIVAGAYAAKKIFNSTANLLQGKKIGKSLFRLGAIMGGIVLGTFYGPAIGATVGALAGIGSFAGAILGGVCGALITAGVAALVAKYSAKFISWCIYHNDLNAISTTNPEKYAGAFKKLNSHGKNTSQARIMLTKLQDQKNEHCSFPGTKDRAQKEKYNTLLKTIAASDPQYYSLTTGTIANGYAVNSSCFFWNNREWQEETIAPILRRS